jgi:hypothetical protein
MCVVLAVGGWLRLSGANWDAGNHLHPDERYLSIVADNLEWPHSVGAYLDVHTSPLSPYNTEPGRDYVYGTFPLFATKLVAAALNRDDYDHLNLVGRRLSALLDLGTIILVFLIARLVLGNRSDPAPERIRASIGGLIAAAAYALTVTSIQFSHFGTTDSWLVFFGTLTFYFALRAVIAPTERSQRFELWWLATGIAFGLTVACKASGALLGAALVIALIGRTLVAKQCFGVKEAAVRLAAGVVALAVPAYLSFRTVSPYAFQSSFWLNPSVSHAYRAALDSQQAALEGKYLAPPGYQWLLSPRVADPLKNLVVWQLGFPLGATAIAGLCVMGGIAVRRLLARRHRHLGVAEVTVVTVQLMLLGTVALQFFWFATLFAHSGRYLVSIAPLLAVAAAYGLVRLLQRRDRALAAATAVLLATTAVYAIGFHTIYDRTNTRVAASGWIERHVPAGNVIANENWDDSLPLGAAFQRYHGVTVPVFDPDDDVKLDKLQGALAAADYYVVSSPRAWRTIGRLPGRFPLMVRFYRQLFADRLGFERVASFDVKPRLLGYDLDDLGAEEAFWVYDHPPVMIFRRTRGFSPARLKSVLCTPAIPGICD